MASKTSTSPQTKNIITIVFLFLIPIIGLILMWVWSGWKTWVKVIVTIAYFLFFFIVFPVLFVILYAFVLRPYAINGQAMHPNFKNGEYVMSQPYSGDSSIQRGSVVVYATPQGMDIIKRVIGLPGDTVSILDSKIYINGEKLDESSYLSPEVETYGGEFLQEGEAVVVPDNSYFLMGDNRSFSSDSRNSGFIDGQNIVALPKFCYWNCK